MSKHHPWGFSSGASILCPGKVPMEAKALAMGIGEGDTADADRGTFRHQLVASGLPLEAIPEEHRWAVKRAREWGETFGSGDRWEQTLSIRLDGEDVNFGTVDRMGFGEKRPFALDWKHGESMPHLDLIRWQMECAAVGAGQHYGVSEVDVGVFHVPSGTEWRETIGHLDDLAQSIKAKIDYAKAHPEELNYSGATCAYCKAKPICPEFTKHVALAKKPEVNGEVMASAVFKLLTLKPAANRAFEWATEEAKKLPEDVLAAHGFRRRTVTMPRMNQVRSGETYEQIRIERKGS